MENVSVLVVLTTCKIAAEEGNVTLEAIVPAVTVPILFAVPASVVLPVAPTVTAASPPSS